MRRNSLNRPMPALYSLYFSADFLITDFSVLMISDFNSCPSQDATDSHQNQARRFTNLRASEALKTLVFLPPIIFLTSLLQQSIEIANYYQ